MFGNWKACCLRVAWWSLPDSKLCLLAGSPEAPGERHRHTTPLGCSGLAWILLFESSPKLKLHGTCFSSFGTVK